MLFFLGAMIPQGWVILVLQVAANVPLYTLIPRFVMNIRELYVLDMQGRCDIDTGFGLSGIAGRSVGGMTTIETIAFADDGGIGGLHGGEETAAANRAQSGGRQAFAV